MTKEERIEEINTKLEELNDALTATRFLDESFERVHELALSKKANAFFGAIEDRYAELVEERRKLKE